MRTGPLLPVGSHLKYASSEGEYLVYSEGDIQKIWMHKCMYEWVEKHTVFFLWERFNHAKMLIMLKLIWEYNAALWYYRDELPRLQSFFRKHLVPSVGIVTCLYGLHLVTEWGGGLRAQVEPSAEQDSSKKQCCVNSQNPLLHWLKILGSSQLFNVFLCLLLLPPPSFHRFLSLINSLKPNFSVLIHSKNPACDEHWSGY